MQEKGYPSRDKRSREEGSGDEEKGEGENDEDQEVTTLYNPHVASSFFSTSLLCRRSLRRETVWNT